MGYEAQARDTSVEIDRMMMEAYRAMPLPEKARRFSELCRSASFLGLSGIRARRPGISEREARLRLAALTYGSELVRQAFGWAPDDDGR
jgi:hypothetical protein